MQQAQIMRHQGQMPLLLERLLAYLRLYPDKIAYEFLMDEKKSKTLTNKQLLRGAKTIAHRLNHSNSSGRALLIFNPGFEFIQALFGCFLSNTSAIPIAIPKPKSIDLFKHFLAHANPDYIITTSNLTERISWFETDLHRLPTIIEVDNLSTDEVLYPLPAITNDIAIIQYTSGSTSNPKGVTVSFDNLYHNLQAIKNHFGLTETSVCFSWLPHYHDMGLVDGLLSPLFNRCKGIICSPLTVVANPLNWLLFIDRFKVTHTGGPNFIFELCVDKIPNESIAAISLRSLSHFYVSAEPVRKTTLEKFSDFCKNAGFKSSQFTPGYGLAEATLMVTCKERNEPLTFHTMEENGYTKHYVGLGKTIPGITLKIINPVTLKELPENQQGEIVLSGSTITKGYYNDNESSQAAMIQIVEKDTSNTYLRTGDLGLLVGGELFITGRIKDTIIIRAIQYRAEDIEYVAASCHPYLFKTGSAAFSVEVDEVEQLVVLQEIKREHWDNCNHGEVINKIREAVFNSFGLNTHDVILAPQGSIPKTTSGKIKRKDSKRQYEQTNFQKKI